MKLLVPTDFSEPSKAALLYAAHMAKKIQGEITILWFNSIQSSTKTLNKWKMLEADMIAIAEEDAKHLVEEVLGNMTDKPRIEYHFTSGPSFAISVNDYAANHDIDMIVMGTRGATGLKKVLIGSNAAAMIDNSTVPVLVVPEKAVFNSFKKIVYASSLSEIDLEVKTIAALAALYEASLHILHVSPSNSHQKLEKTFVPELVRSVGYSNIIYKDVKDDNIARAIDDYILTNQVDLLAMFTHKLSPYEKLFGKSVTRELAFYAHVPLLAFNKTLLT